MDAYKIFNKLLREIDNSTLNYSVSKTPYSASISLKCSFARRFTANHANVNDDSVVVESVERQNDEKCLIENKELKSRVVSLEQNVLGQKGVTKHNVETENKLLKEMDENAAEFRAEVLKVKKERKEYGTKAKALESEQ